MFTSELDGMVRNEQYKDMIREARDLERVAEAGPRTPHRGVPALLLLPVMLVSVAARLINLFAHVGHPS